MTIMSNHPIKTNPNMPKAAKWLGYLGSVPFVISSLGVFFLASDPFLSGLFRATLIGYGADILSFLGGIRWGTALSRSDSSGQNWEMALSILPPFFGWICVLVPNPAAALLLLSCCYVWQIFIDMRATRRAELPIWFGHMRIRLTILAITCLLFGAISLL